MTKRVRHTTRDLCVLTLCTTPYLSSEYDATANCEIPETTYIHTLIPPYTQSSSENLHTHTYTVHTYCTCDGPDLQSGVEKPLLTRRPRQLLYTHRGQSSHTRQTIFDSCLGKEVIKEGFPPQISSGCRQKRPQTLTSSLLQLRQASVRWVWLGWSWGQGLSIHHTFRSTSPSHTTHTDIYTQIYTHTDIYTQIYTHRYIHTQIYTHTDIYTQIYTHTDIYTQIYTHTDIYTHRYIHTQIYTHTDIYTHRYIHTQIYTHTDIYTHRYIHTQIYTHTDIYTQIYTHRYIHTDIYTHRYIHTQIYTHTTHTDIYTHTKQTYLHTPHNKIHSMDKCTKCTHLGTHSPTHSLTHPLSLSHTHTHTHTHSVYQQVSRTRASSSQCWQFCG